MKYLFIGGVADGKRLHVDKKIHKEMALYEGELYNRTIIYGNTLYVHKDFNSSDLGILIKILIDNYLSGDTLFGEETPYSLNEGVQSNMDTVQRAIISECQEVSKMLLKKNESYGNSAIEPNKFFSKLDWEDRINVRIDDKINRIAKGNEFIGEDTELDLIGYLILKRVGRKVHKGGNP